MNIQEAYDKWSDHYDTNLNKTRDLEAIALRETLATIPFDNCLEIGCGTGKNTAWFITCAKHITAIDFSEQMLSKAKEKISAERVVFIQADINKEWSFATSTFDLISFSLVLEHIQNLDAIFRKAAKVLNPGGFVYVGELHPFKQYSGSKARFDTSEGQQILSCFNHHITDFTGAARQHGLELVGINEYFDELQRTTVPRILTLLFRKM